MIEIDIAVDLFHPSDTVWRALTERALLAKWFAESVPVADAPDRLLLRTAGLPGYDADIEATVVERRAPELLVLNCLEGARRTRLSCRVVPTGHGCRLSVREALEHGDWDAAQRDRRTEHHQHAVTVRLPAILDWVAFQRIDLRRAEGGLTAELPVVRLTGDARSRTGRRRVWVIGALACLALALAGGLAFWATRPTPPAQDAAPQSAPLRQPATTSPAPGSTPSRSAPSTTRSSAAPTPTPTPTAPPTRTPSASLAPATALTARYQTVSDRVLGYRGEVVVTNPGSAAKQGWAVIVTLGEEATISKVSGAEWQQDGRVVTFTGPAVPAGGSTTFRFDVRDRDMRAKAPEGCAVEGSPCSVG
ncbi:cellulose binding domain-containing protein [Micromonospora sp. SL4-19]|uniref:cellulose binding domain-containing protein n=1 Tax=Micromonospora sp. SL4-19 TaxID=3399129 RepID=UPI003A4E6257